MRLAVRVCMGVCLTGLNPAFAIKGGADVPQNDHRFDAVGATIWTNQLVPGECEGGTCHDTGGGATLIATDLVITAKHVLQPSIPPAANVVTIRFRINPNGSFGAVDESLGDDGWSSFYHVKVVQWWYATTYDIALGRLEHCVTHIEPLHIRLVGSSQVPAGTQIWQAGWGNEGECEPVSTEVEGDHMLKVCCNVALGHPSELFMFWLLACDELNPCDDETYLPGGVVGHDSGGPALIEGACGNPEYFAMLGSGAGTMLGAVEGDSAIPLAVYTATCPADLNYDQVVSGLDLAIMLGNWGGVGTTNGDLNCSGAIDGTDLAILLADWGFCPDPCGEGAAPFGGAGSGSESSSSDPDDDFHQWAMQATIEELMYWLETGCWGGTGG